MEGFYNPFGKFENNLLGLKLLFCEILKSEIQSYREGTCNFTILNFKKELELGQTRVSK